MNETAAPLLRRPAATRRHAARRLREVRRFRAATRDTLRLLTAAVAHEVNQPLSAIVLNASTCLLTLCGDRPNLAVARETARATLRDVDRAAEIIQRLRAHFERRSAGHDQIDLSAVVRDAVALATTELQRHRVALRLDPDDALPRSEAIASSSGRWS